MDPRRRAGGREGCLAGVGVYHFFMDKMIHTRVYHLFMDKTGIHDHETDTSPI